METLQPIQEYTARHTVDVENANFGINRAYNENLIPADVQGSWEMMMAGATNKELGHHHELTILAAKAVINFAMGGVEVAENFEQSGTDIVDFVKKYTDAYSNVIRKEYEPQITELDGFKTEFTGIISIAAMNGLPIDQEKGQKVLAKTKLRPMDSATYFAKIVSHGAADGYNQPLSGNISIPPNLTEQAVSERRKFVYHELLHSLTGGVALKNDLEQVSFFRGMKLDGASGNKEEGSKGRRLNIDEAVINSTYAKSPKKAGSNL